MSGKNVKKNMVLALTLAFLGLFVAGQASADLPAPPAIPDLPPAATTVPDSGSSQSGNSPPQTVFVPAMPSTTPTPTPTPVPHNTLEVVIPDSINVNGVNLSVWDNIIYAPGGTALADIIQNDTFDFILPSSDDSTSRLAITIDAINASAASLRSVRLTSEKPLEVNGTKIGVTLKATIVGWPAGGRLDAVLMDPGLKDRSNIGEQLEGSVQYEPLAIVDVKKYGLENGKDIVDCDILLTVERPGSIGENASYTALRQSDGIYEQLDVTLLNDSSPMIFEIQSPGGFSEFTLVEAIYAAQDVVPEQPAPASEKSTSPAMIFLAAMNFAAIAIIGYVFVKSKAY